MAADPRRHLQPVREPTTRAVAEANLRRRLHQFAGRPVSVEAAEQLVRETLADFDAHAAHMIERHARPPVPWPLGPGGAA